MADLKLILGNRNYSSWSLRPWIAMRHAGIEFDEEVVRLNFDGDGSANAGLKQHSPSGRVPVLLHGGLRIWESLSILEYVAELYPEAAFWPEDIVIRARARTAAHEMHAGFSALRSELPMNIRRKPGKVAYSAEAGADIGRVIDIFDSCRKDHGDGGPFLFGTFSIADAMFAPVCSRLSVYDIALDGQAQDYVAAMLELPAFAEWRAAAEAEPWTIGEEER